WMLDGLRAWIEAGLRPLGIEPQIGRIEGAWCPGFSDVGVGGRKLAGLGFRVTRDWVLMRGVMAVSPVDAADWELLAACHRLIDVDIRPQAATSLVETTGDPSWTVDSAIEHLQPIAV